MKHLTILTLFLWLCCGCANEYDDNRGPEKSTFTVAEARTYFENSSMQVADLSFSEPHTRAGGMVLTPDWEGAKITGTSEITTIEAPLSGEDLREVTVFRTTPHMFEERHLHPSEVDAAVKATGWVYMQIKLSETLDEARAGEIFDNWMSDYETYRN